MKKSWLLTGFILLVCLAAIAAYIIHREDAGRKIDQPIPHGNIEIPHQKTFTYNETSQLKEEIINHWINGELEDWKDTEKVGIQNPRIILACLLSGQRIEEVNKYIMRQQATGVAGSRWLLNPEGGYNFGAMAMTPVLYLFHDKPELLYPETRAHLIKNILTIDGDGFTRKVPNLYIEDSENHILMTECSRYLKNKWLWEHGETNEKYNNNKNGVEKGLKTFLEEIYEYGIYEFNADPYLGYTYCSLLNLHAFADGEINLLAEKILDRINWKYALASSNFNFSPPYRRRFEKEVRTTLHDDYHTAFMKVWSSLYSDTLNIEINRGRHHALWAVMLPYRPPDKTIEWTLQKSHNYFIKVGHGYKSCPEILSGGRDYLISAGGANQGRSSLIVSKPITLMLNDQVTELQETFHMFGPGDNMTNWNNTGVYKDFAVTKGAVHIPKTHQVVVDKNGWKMFQISLNTFLAVYSESELGIMAVVKSGSAEKVMEVILSNNDPMKLKSSFFHPNGNHIEYDLDAPKDTWVITKVNDQSVNRNFQEWAFFDGDLGSMD